METTESIFKLMHYNYECHYMRKLHYPKFRVSSSEEVYFRNLRELEAYMQKMTRRYYELNESFPVDDTYIDTYAYVAIEVPLGMEVSIYGLDDSLSIRIYKRDGTLWGIKTIRQFLSEIWLGL